YYINTFTINFFCLLIWRQSWSTLFPYTTLFRSSVIEVVISAVRDKFELSRVVAASVVSIPCAAISVLFFSSTSGLYVLDILDRRSEEHTSELQSRENIVCRLLLEKKNLFMLLKN